MSIAAMVYVTCDACGTPCGGTEGMRDTATEARGLALHMGWKRRPAKGTDMRRPRRGATLADVCPDCQHE